MNRRTLLVNALSTLFTPKLEPHSTKRALEPHSTKRALEPHGYHELKLYLRQDLDLRDWTYPSHQVI